MILIDGQIKPDSEVGKYLGFTSDKFEGWLWKTGLHIWISMIISKKPGKGNFSKLFNKIKKHNLHIVVPSPLGRMPFILEAKGFHRSKRFSEEMGEAFETMELFIDEPLIKRNKTK